MVDGGWRVISVQSITLHHPPTTMRPYRIELATALALAVLALGALGHACWNGFVNFDDDDYVVRNRHVKAGLSVADAAWAFTTTHAANWHPLTWLSLQLDASVYGTQSAWGFHLTNVLLHAAGVVLLFLALRLMTGAVGRSAIVAALFGVHPAHVESVAWVAERKDVLSGLFWMLTLLAYAWYVRRPGWGRYLAVLAAFALGLMAKPMLVTLPCVLLLLDYWPLGRLWSVERGAGSVERGARSAAPALGVPRSALHLLLEKVPFFALTAAACLATMHAQKGAVNTLEQLPLSERLTNTLGAYAGYLGEMVFPSGLAPFYPHPHGRLLLEQAGRSGLLLAAISALVVWARRRRYLTVGWLWFLGTLVPVIGLVQVGSQGMADRYTYIPYIGLFIALTWGAADLVGRRPAMVHSVGPLATLLAGIWTPLGFWLVTGAGAEMMSDGILFASLAVLTTLAVIGWMAGRRFGLIPERVPVPAVVLALLLGLCVALSAWQVRLWNNSIWLWEYTVAVTRDNVTGHNNLGDAYWNSVHPERIEKARANFLDTLRLQPDHPRAHNNLGMLYLDQGLLDDAAAQLTLARRADPTLAVVVQNLGIVQARRYHFAEAIAFYQEALRLDPGLAGVYDRLGQARAAQGQWEEGETAFRGALALEPKDLPLRADRAWALWHLGRESEAVSEYAAVTAADPAWPEKTRGDAWRWATDPNARRRNGFEAVRKAEEAYQAHGACDPPFEETLGAARAQLWDEVRERLLGLDRRLRPGARPIDNGSER
jgi:protein O-mannosyl-transferase